MIVPTIAQSLCLLDVEAEVHCSAYVYYCTRRMLKVGRYLSQDKETATSANANEKARLETLEVKNEFRQVTVTAHHKAFNFLLVVNIVPRAQRSYGHSK